MSDIKFNIGADGSGVLTELRRVRGGVGAMTADVRSAGDVTSAAFGKVAAALSVGAVVAFVDSLTQAADELADVAEAVNVNVASLQGLRLAAGDAGAAAGALDSALGSLQKNIGQAAQGTGRAREAFELLGLEADELAGLKTDEALYRVADALNQLDTAAERAGLAQKLLGDGAKELRPLLEAGGDALRANVEAYADTAYVLDNETVVALAAANRQMERLGALAKVTAAEMSVGFVSVVTAAAVALAEMNAAGERAGRTGERLGAQLASLGYGASTAWNVVTATLNSSAAALANILSLATFGEARKDLQALAADFDRFARQSLDAIESPAAFAQRVADGVAEGITQVELASTEFGAFGDEFRGELSADTLAFVGAITTQTEAALAPMRAAVAEAERISKYLAATQGRQFGQGVNARGLVSQDDPFNPLENTSDPFGENAGLMADVQARLEADITAAAQEQLDARLDAYSAWSDAYLALTGERIENELALERIKGASVGEIGGTLLATFAATNEKVAKLAQNLALAQAIWQTSAAVTKFLSTGNFGAAAKAGAMGAIQIAKIKATKYSGSVVSGGASYPAGAAGGEANERVADNAQQQRTIEVQIKGALTDQAGRVIADLVRKEVRDRNVVIIDSDSRQARELVGG